MPAKSTDRRVQRTRRLLQDALLAMIVEKGYEHTTVQDVIDRADVGRSTFYAHFADKETLLSSTLSDLRLALRQRQRDALGARGEPGERGLAFGLPMLEHAREHLPLYRAIVGRQSGAYVLRRVHATIAELVDTDLDTLGFRGTPERRALAVQYVTGAFVSVLGWWLDQDARLPCPEVDGIFRRLAMQGLSAELEAGRDPG